MFSELETIIRINELHVETLLYGSGECKYNINKHIFDINLEFINERGRL